MADNAKTPARIGTVNLGQFDPDDRTINVPQDQELNEQPVTEEKAITRTEADDTEPFPEGGLKAWLVVLGGVCTTFSTFGYVNSWGAFQAYYQETIMSDSSSSAIAWIGSLQYSLVFLPGILIGRWFDIGYLKIPYLVCSIVLVLATFLTAQCTVYWQFLLCQGITIGIAAGGLFSPNAAVVGQYFLKRRGIAFGIVATGSSIGGTVLPIAVRKLIPQVGFPWTMRIVGFILLLTLGTANLTLNRRLPPRKTSGSQFDFKIFKYKPFTVYCVSSIFVFLGLYTLLTFINVSTVEAGFSSDFAFYLVSIANACSLFGRLASGYSSDMTGPLNIMIPLTFIAAVVTIAWPFALTQPSLVFVAIFYGFASGSYVSLVGNAIFEMGRPEDTGQRLGLFWGVLAIGALCGPPISGAINGGTHGYNAVGYYAGGCVCVGVLIMMITKRLAIGHWWGKY